MNTMDEEGSIDYVAINKFKTEAKSNYDRTTRSVSNESPRDYFNNVRNSETLQLFINSPTSATNGDYRARFKDTLDPEAQRQIATANDIGYRQMHEDHKKEINTCEHDLIDKMTKKHELEKSLFEHNEAAYFNRRPDDQKLSNALDGWRSVSGVKQQPERIQKAEKPAYSPPSDKMLDDLERKALELNGRDEIHQPFTVNTVAQAQQRLLAMRQQHGIKPSISR